MLSELDIDRTTLTKRCKDGEEEALRMEEQLENARPISFTTPAAWRHTSLDSVSAGFGVTRFDGQRQCREASCGGRVVGRARKDIFATQASAFRPEGDRTSTCDMRHATAN